MELVTIQWYYDSGLISTDEWIKRSNKVYDANEDAQNKAINNRIRADEQNRLDKIRKEEDELVAEIEEMLKEEIPEPKRGSGHNDSVGEVKERTSKKKVLVH